MRRHGLMRVIEKEAARTMEARSDSGRRLKLSNVANTCRIERAVWHEPTMDDVCAHKQSECVCMREIES